MTGTSETAAHRLKVGDRVRVLHGRWKHRYGTFVRYHYNPGGLRQQGQLYPVVDLEPRGKAGARQVRVLAVERANKR